MKASIAASFVLAVWLSFFVLAAAIAQNDPADTNGSQRGDVTNDPEDPGVLLPQIRQRGQQRDALFQVSPLGELRNGIDRVKQDLYEEIGLELGFAFTHLSQGLSEALPGKDQSGSAADMNFLGTWELIDRGQPTQGELFFQVQGRWDYGTTAPGALGTESLGSLIQTANVFSAYEPTFLLRNLYWRHGSKDAGWVYRLGKITPDAILSTSSHISALTTFLPTAGSGPFANALPDSGLGIVGGWFINDRVTLAGLVSDANADRFDFGDLGEGDLYKAAELQVKIAPRTSKAGYSKITLWHNDGTKDGKPINGSSGAEGWGIFVKHEQELTDDGRLVGILRWGKGFDDSAFYEQQAGAHLLLYDPPVLDRIQNDVVGVAFNWARASNPLARDEYDIEAFYRFPIIPHVDMTLIYQSLFKLALDPTNNHAAAFSVRIRTTF